MDGQPDVAVAPFLEREERPLVLYVIQHHDYSGAEILQVPLMRADPEPLLACPPGTRTEEFARELGIPTVPLAYRVLRHSGGPLETLRSVYRGLAAARDLRRVLRSRPERQVVYCTSLRPALLASVAAAGLGRRVVWSLTDLMPPAPLRGAVRLLARAGCDRAIALSQVIADDFAGSSRRLRSLVQVVHPGVELERFDPPAEAAGRPRAGIVGHVSPTKRTDLAVEIAERVLREVPEFELEVIGRAQYRADDFELERRLVQRVEADDRLRDRVHFRGYATDVPGELRRLGLLLHCRPDEPFGLVLIEAMAIGLPVVAPAAAGPLEIVEHGVSGFLYEPGDAATAAAHVVRIVGDPELAAAMSTAARAAVERRFTAAAQLAAVDRELAGVAARARPATSA